TDPIGINEISNTIPEDFKLFQNYPNPFNPSTKIKFAVPKADFVSLKIYDNSGKEIYSLAGQKLNPGTYSFDWNSADNSGNNVSSGVYFCKLISGNYMETIKMLLVR
ncbi:MAG TPA: FlgD immunoglobulin-like domain containing protein, partial [Ignavibacteria bacterium]|nr:FlgD immunoglobulin-like domain containing protein [Ignavibacteria bacterium]